MLEVVATAFGVVGAVVAAVTGVWNLRLLLRGKRDEFRVGLGAVAPTIEQETMMHVISHSDHPIKLKDYGFIELDGKLTSIPMAWEIGDLQSEEISTRGVQELRQRSDTWEAGYKRRHRPIGAYAISVTQATPTLGFDSHVAMCRRLWLSWRIARKW